MRADVWQQSLYDEGAAAGVDGSGYGTGLPSMAGLPAMPQPEEEEAEEHEAGETFMVHLLMHPFTLWCMQVLVCMLNTASCSTSMRSVGCITTKLLCCKHPGKAHGSHVR